MSSTRRDSTPDPELSRKLSRRGILGVAAGATAAALLGATAPPPPPRATGHGKGHGRPLLPPGRLGIQLYTLRDKVSTLGFAAVFEELSRSTATTRSSSPATPRGRGASPSPSSAAARDHGLRAIGSHVGYYTTTTRRLHVRQNLTKVLDDAQALGLQHIGHRVRALAATAAPSTAGSAAPRTSTRTAPRRKARGMKFYQHNHADGVLLRRPTGRTSACTTSCSPRPTPTWSTWRWTSTGRTSGQYRFGKRAGRQPRRPSTRCDYVLEQPDRYPLFHVKDGERDETTGDGYHMVGRRGRRHRLPAVHLGRTRTHGGRLDHHWQTEHDTPPDSLSFARRSSAYLHSLREKDC